MDVTIHAVHQLVWPAPTSDGAEMSTTEALGLLRKFTTATVPSPQVKVTLGDSTKATEVQPNSSTAVFETRLEWRHLPAARSSESSDDLDSLFTGISALVDQGRLQPTVPPVAPNVLRIDVYHAGMLGAELIGRCEKNFRMLPLKRAKLPIAHPSAPQTPRGFITVSATSPWVAEAAGGRPAAPLEATTMEYKPVSREIRVYWGQYLPTGCFVSIRKGSTVCRLPVKRNQFVWNSKVSLPGTIPSVDDYVSIELWIHQPPAIRRRISRVVVDIQEFTEDVRHVPRWIHFHRSSEGLDEERVLPVKRNESLRTKRGMMRMLTNLSMQFTAEDFDSDQETEQQVGFANARNLSNKSSVVLDYCGKLLISTSVDVVIPITQLDPTPLPSTEIPDKEPPESTYDLSYDCYALNIASDQRNNPYALEISVGEMTWKCPSFRHLRTGRLECSVEPQRISLPPMHQAPPLVVRLVPSTEERRGPAYASVLPVHKLMEAGESAPIWMPLTSVPKVTDAPVVSILQSIRLKSVRSDAPMTPAPDRINYELKPFIFTARLIQAANVPLLDRDVMPTSSMALEFEGHTVETVYVPEDSCPEFNLDYVTPLHLPTRVEMIAPLAVTVRVRRSGSSDLQIVSHLSIPIGHITKMRLSVPQWFVCESPLSQKPCMVLLAAELYDGSLSIDDICDAMPPLRHCTIPVMLTVLGLRLLPFAKFRRMLPALTLSHKRVVEESDEEWLTSHSLIGMQGRRSGYKGICSFDQTFTICVYTTPTGLYLDLIRFLLWQSDEELEGWDCDPASPCRVTGFGHLPLFPHAAWLPTGLRHALAAAFAPNTPELAQIDITTTYDTRGAYYLAPMQRSQETTESEMKRVGLSLGVEPCLQENVYVRKCVALPAAVYTDLTPEARQVIMSLTQTEEEDVERSSEVLALAEPELSETPYLRTKSHAMRDQLPYSLIPLIGSHANDRESLLGTVKCIFTLPSKPFSGLLVEDDLQNTAIYQRMLEEHSRKVTAFVPYREAFVVRLNIHNGTGLVSRHPRREMGSDPVWTVLAMIGDGEQTAEHVLQASDTGGLMRSMSDLPVYEDDDRAAAIDQTLKTSVRKVWAFDHASVGSADFFTSVELTGYFPLNSILQLCIIEHLQIPTSSKDTENAFINSSTHVDLEDRWYNFKCNNKLETIETLTLFRASSSKPDQLGHPSGNLRVSIRLYKPEELKYFVAKPLQREQFLTTLQLRFAVLDVQLPPSDAVHDLFVRVVYNNDAVFDSDTHYRAENGHASFNWRFVFDAETHGSHILLIQLWSYGILRPNNLLFEKELDLTSQINGQKLQAKRVSLALPNDGFVNAYLSIVDANAPAVGAGRDEPNRDPYLKPVIEHRNLLLEGQDFVESVIPTSVVNFAISANQTIKNTTRYITIGITLIFVLLCLSTLKSILSNFT